MLVEGASSQRDDSGHTVSVSSKYIKTQKTHKNDMATKVQRVMVQPINLIFRMLQQVIIDLYDVS